MNKSWLEHYRTNYYNLLNPKASGAKRALIEGIYQRAAGFDIMFDLLLQQRQQNFLIVETGTLRNPGNWKDGQSAILFTQFVDWHGGQMRSVDIDPTAVNTARSYITSSNFAVTCGDSVTWLQSMTDRDQVDLYYLDSWDVKWHNDSDSAQHHLQEFLAVEPFLKTNSIVAIDDNSRFADTGLRTGKGRAIVEYLESKNHHPIYDAYQIIFQF